MKHTILDLGSYTWKIVEVNKDTLEYVKILKTNESNQIDILKDLTANISNKNVHVLLSEKLFNLLILPLRNSQNLNGKELKEVILLKISNLLSMSKEQIHIGYQCFGDNTFVEVINKTSLTQYEKLLKSLRLNPLSLSCGSFNVLNLCEDKTFVLLHIGNTCSRFYFVNQKIPILVRILNIPTLILPLKGEEIGEVLKILFHFVQDNLMFISKRYRVSPNCIYLSGGRAGLDNIDNYFEEYFQIPARPVDPISKLALKKGITINCAESLVLSTSIGCVFGLVEKQ